MYPEETVDVLEPKVETSKYTIHNGVVMLIEDYYELDKER